MNFKLFKLSLNYISKILESISPFFFTAYIRYKKLENEYIKQENYEVYESLDATYGILLQGPIISANNFTLETIKLYRLIYPNVQIVVSTSQDEDVNALNLIKQAGADVITYTAPSFRGIKNINMQITSTSNGITYLKSIGVEYILKARTDQRCCKNIDFLSYMQNLQHNFPLGNKVLSERIVIVSTNSFKTRLYPVTDMFMFGKIQDIEKYWCIPMDNNSEYDKNPDPVLFMKYNVVEGYLLNTFARNINYELLWTEKDSADFMAKYFCLIDQEQIDLYWNKYEKYLEDPFMDNIDLRKHRLRFEFSDWLLALTNLQNKQNDNTIS